MAPWSAVQPLAALLIGTWLQLCCCSLLNAAPAPRPHSHILEKAVYDPKNIVDNVNDCPVKNVYFDPVTEFNYKSAARFQDVLQAQNVSKPCIDATIDSLAVCLSDGSFRIKYGCCSQRCKQGFQKALDTGCAKEYRWAACNDPRGGPLVLSGDVMMKRCNNFLELSCEEALLKYANAKGMTGSSASSSSSSSVTGQASSTEAVSKGKAGTSQQMKSSGGGSSTVLAAGWAMRTAAAAAAAAVLFCV